MKTNTVTIQNVTTGAACPTNTKTVTGTHVTGVSCDVIKITSMSLTVSTRSNGHTSYPDVTIIFTSNANPSDTRITVVCTVNITKGGRSQNAVIYSTPYSGVEPSYTGNNLWTSYAYIALLPGDIPTSFSVKVST